MTRTQRPGIQIRPLDAINREVMSSEQEYGATAKLLIMSTCYGYMHFGTLCSIQNEWSSFKC